MSAAGCLCCLQCCCGAAAARGALTQAGLRSGVLLDWRRVRLQRRREGRPAARGHECHPVWWGLGVRQVCERVPLPALPCVTLTHMMPAGLPHPGAVHAASCCMQALGHEPCKSVSLCWGQGPAHRPGSASMLSKRLPTRAVPSLGACAGDWDGPRRGQHPHQAGFLRDLHRGRRAVAGPVGRPGPAGPRRRQVTPA